MLIEGTNSGNEIIAVLIKLLLDFLRAHNLLDIGLGVDNFSIIVVNLGLSLASHGGAKVVFVLVTSLSLPCLTRLILSLLRLVKTHVSDVTHQIVLILIEHDFVVLIIIIPCLRIAWVLLCQDEDQIVFFKSGVLIRIGHHILNELEIT